MSIEQLNNINNDNNDNIDDNIVQFLDQDCIDNYQNNDDNSEHINEIRNQIDEEVHEK